MDKWHTIIKIAEEFGVKEAALVKWRSRGVAHQYRLPIAIEAAKRKVKLTPADFEGPTEGQAA